MENLSEVNDVLNIDDVFKNNPNGYVFKFSPAGRNILINYLNTKPISQVEIFFATMFDIPDQDPMFKTEAIKGIYDFLRNQCPRSESKSIISSTLGEIQIFKITPKVEDNTETEASTK